MLLLDLNFSAEKVRLKEPNRTGKGVIRPDNLLADAHKRKPQILSISFTVSKISGNLALTANLQIKKSV
jgi:hypothetical protein